MNVTAGWPAPDGAGQWAPFKMYVCIAAVLAMVGMNLRGVKESVLTLLPIFIAFVLMHTILVVYALVAWRMALPAIAGSSPSRVHDGFGSLGVLGLAVVFFAGQLVFGDDLNGFMSRFLHNHTALDLLQSLQMHGMSLVILPVRVAPGGTTETVPDVVPAAVPA